jgi:YYY domain-containing protein
MIAFLSWYLVIALVGILAIPLAYRLLPNLSDRGYALARPLGLILWGFFFWLLTSFQILQNDIGGVLLALAILAGLSAWSIRGKWQEMFTWYRGKTRLLVTGEVLFLVAFAFLAVVRAANPDITGTEKPMELAFINAILRSPKFPPMDPWLSGYAISYYYFGYVMVAMLIRMTGVISGVGFNLAISLWFAMTALGAYGILYSLLNHWFSQKLAKAKERKKQAASTAGAGWALLAPFFILIVSNIEGFLEMLHARGIFWTTSANGTMQSGFWTWLNILELDKPPSLPLSWIPTRVGGIWWWRASRVLQDFDLLGQPREIIDEFPFFSYLLSDLHPHVLAMPFAMLVIALALNLYYQASRVFGSKRILPAIIHWAKADENPADGVFLFSWMKRADFWLAAVLLGGLAFINTWDFPIYVALFCCTFTLVRYQQQGWSWRRIWEFIELGLALGIVGVLLYLPFYTGFASQAGGILPSLDFFTRGVYFWVMFATLLLPMIAWLIWLWRKQGSLAQLKRGLVFSAWIVGGLWVFSYLLGEFIIGLPALVSILPGGGQSGLSAKLSGLVGVFADLHGGVGSTMLMTDSMLHRFLQPGTWILLFFLLAVVWGLLAGSRPKPAEGEDQLPSEPSVESPAEIISAPETRSPQLFALLLALTGIGLTLVPEFVYLRDQFGWRMNTIFKFYFQTWILWGMVAAFGTAILLNELKKQWKLLHSIGLVVLILMSLAYPVFGLLTKTNNFNPGTWTLDGTNYMQVFNPDEMDAIRWLQQAPLGVVAEGVGGSYSAFARVSEISGQQTVLGWPGHESQWRGGATEIGSRQQDIEQLYKTTSWTDAEKIINQYNIRYIFIGSLERSAYRVSETKFQNNLKVVFQKGSVTIYEYSGPAPIDQVGP